MKSLATDILDRLLNVLPKTDYCPLHEPSFQGNEYKYVKNCIDASYISSVGKYVDAFEDLLADYCGSKYAVAMVNGTTALFMALKLADIQSDDEVLVPNLTFVATANAVRHCHAIPHFVDSEQTSLGINPEKLDTYLSEICDIRQGICKTYHLILIEDAAESLGSLYKGQHTGTFGVCTVLSFNGNKTITTSGGPCRS